MAHNRLGRLAIVIGDVPSARRHYAEALQVADDIGSRAEKERALEGLAATG